MRTLLQEARRVLDKKSEYQVALELAEQAARLAQSKDEHQACDSLLAEIHFQQASTRAGQARLDNLELAVMLAPEESLYRVHLARALEQDGRIDEALVNYQAANQIAENSGVGFLWCVAALEAGRPLPAADLASAEQNTLDIVQHLISNGSESVPLFDRHRPELVEGLRTLLIEPVLNGSLPLWRALAQMLADEEVAPAEDLMNVTSVLRVEGLDGAEATGIAHYYLGVAALRAGDLDAAWRALADAQKSGYSSPWLEENLGYLSRAQAIRRAGAGDWKGVIGVGEPILREGDDRILAETVSLAHFHLGYDAAQAGDWATATHHWQQAERYHSNRYLAQNLALAREQQEDWEGAAEAWRDMVRRRPRKKDHPSYLDDNQVAGLWRHAAECYKRANDPAEAVTCLRNGIKYAPDDVEFRRELSEALMANEQFDAAENELNRILERDPEDVDALVSLGRIYDTDNWWRSEYKLTQVLSRALELDPGHEEAREILATHYLQQGRRYVQWGMYGEAVKQYWQGLEHLPDYALLYVKLANAERYQGHREAAREHLLHAYELEPDRARTAGPVLHELLHLDAEEAIERLLPQIRQMSGLLPGFWVEQGEKVLGCKLNLAWAEQFFDEALALVGQPWVTETRAEVLVSIVMTLSSAEESTGGLNQRYRKRIDREAPRSGAKELVDGLAAMFKEHNWNRAERLLGKARHRARKAGEEGLMDKIEAAEELLFESPLGMFDLLGQLFG